MDNHSRPVGAFAGTAFVVLVLTGNTLTESVVGTDESPVGTAADLAAQAASTTARAGFALELFAMLCLAVFAATVTAVGLRPGSRAAALAVLTSVAAGIFVAVKAAMAAPLLAALEGVDTLPDDVLQALVDTNGAAFVLSWLPMALFVGCAGAVLRRAGLVGTFLGGAALLLGVLGVGAAVVGAAWPTAAVPIPFLLGLVWIAAAGVRVATGLPRAPRRDEPAAAADSAHEHSAG